MRLDLFRGDILIMEAANNACYRLPVELLGPFHQFLQGWMAAAGDQHQAFVGHMYDQRLLLALWLEQRQGEYLREGDHPGGGNVGSGQRGDRGMNSACDGHIGRNKDQPFPQPAGQVPKGHSVLAPGRDSAHMIGMRVTDDDPVDFLPVDPHPGHVLRERCCLQLIGIVPDIHQDRGGIRADQIGDAVAHHEIVSSSGFLIQRHDLQMGGRL